MHYVILRFCQINLNYEIVHYTHDFEDMERMMTIYPEKDGYIHMIDTKYLKSHEILLKVKQVRENARAKGIIV